MKEKLWTMTFTLLVTIVFGFMVSGVNALLSERKAMNSQAARQQVILRLMNFLPTGTPTPDPKALAALFNEKVQVLQASGTKGLAFEFFRPRESTSALYVFPFSGNGFWDIIRGYVAIDGATKTIRTIEFTEHAETPGLGGRISEDFFKKRFTGLALNQPDESGKRVRFVSEGSPKKPGDIDGITGASGTTGGLERFLNESFALFLQIIERGNG